MRGGAGTSRKQKVDGGSKRALEELREFGRARLLEDPGNRLHFEIVPAHRLRPGDSVLVLADDMVPADGHIVDGTARVDESALIGAHEPILRSARHGAADVAAGTHVLSGWLQVEVTAGPEHCRLRELVEGTLH